MPFRTYKYVVLLADTRALEMFLGWFNVVWSGWLVSKGAYATPEFWALVDHYGGAKTWATLGVLLGILQILAVWFRYPRYRMATASLACTYWGYLAYASYSTGPQLFYAWMASAFTLGHFWIVMHRSSTGAPPDRPRLLKGKSDDLQSGGDLGW